MEDNDIIWSERKVGELMQMDRLTRASAERVASVFLFYHKLRELRKELEDEHKKRNEWQG